VTICAVTSSSTHGCPLVRLDVVVFSLDHTDTTDISTLSLHDALPI